MTESHGSSPIIRLSGIYDTVVLMPFAIPGLSAWALEQLAWVNGQLGLPGTVPNVDGTGLLFLNMMACLAILYAALRIWKPNRLYGGFDVAARLLMASLLLTYLLAYGVAGVFWVFFAVECLWAIAQAAAIARQDAGSGPRWVQGTKQAVSNA